MQACIKVLQEPYDQRCRKNNGKCFLNETLCFLPDQLSHAFCRGKTIVWELHDKWYRLTFIFGFLQDQRIQNTTKDTCKIKTDHHNASPLFREKSTGKKSVNWKLGTAAHKRSQQNRHLPVTFTGQCSCCHNSRYGTSKSDQHRHKTSSGKSDLSKKFVHNKSHPGHISGIFQN